MKKVRAIFLVTCFLIVAIGPLNVLQLVAWGNMIHDYSSERAISEAANMTFSGEYPCEMCLRLAEAKSHAIDQQKPLPFQSEERHTLRPVLHCQEDSVKANLNWANASSLQGDWLEGRNPYRIVF
ncbi:MAG: hypothetical protein ACJAVK_003530 [Akkermansiaceae bacterium]|jgi:hypothetical protein